VDEAVLNKVFKISKILIYLSHLYISIFALSMEEFRRGHHSEGGHERVM
jgi:hypothetical protein